MKRQYLLLAPITAICSLMSACTTTYVTPMAVCHPRRLDVSPSQSVMAPGKTFTIPHDWQYDSWVMKKGARITFFEDGTGEFNGTVFSQYSTQHDELHFQSVQYGVDGNALFTFPGSDVGHVLHIRGSMRDFPYTVRFSFNRAYYPYIHDVKFMARLRLAPGTTSYGLTSNRKARNVGEIRIP